MASNQIGMLDGNDGNNVSLNNSQHGNVIMDFSAAMAAPSASATPISVVSAVSTPVSKKVESEKSKQAARKVSRKRSIEIREEENAMFGPSQKRIYRILVNEMEKEFQEQRDRVKMEMEGQLENIRIAFLEKSKEIDQKYAREVAEKNRLLEENERFRKMLRDMGALPERPGPLEEHMRSTMRGMGVPQTPQHEMQVQGLGGARGAQTPVPAGPTKGSKKAQRKKEF